PLLQQPAVRPRVRGRAAGLHGGRVRRHRQHRGGGARRPGHRAGPGLQQRLHRGPVVGRDHLLDPDPGPGVPAHRPAGHAGAREVIDALRARARRIDWRDRNTIVYVVLLGVAVVFPGFVQFMTSGNGLYLVSTAADAGVYILLALGLNVVV